MARLSCGLSAILVFVLSRNLRPMRLSRRPQAFDGSGAIRRRYEQRVDDASLVSDYKILGLPQIQVRRQRREQVVVKTGRMSEPFVHKQSTRRNFPHQSLGRGVEIGRSLYGKSASVDNSPENLQV